MKIDAWTGLGALEGGLGSHFVSQSCLGQKKEARRAKCVRLGAPIWGSVFDMFHDFSMVWCVLFSSLHFGGYQDRFLIDFDRLLGLCLEVFFIIFRIVGK